mmetsp:Transcript_17996/g.46018  ORF Transcript_17996/g.46018 Transcript_17996/m.46018 type:complete len:142 (+) Transcript_17996:72-497(+)
MLTDLYDATRSLHALDTMSSGEFELSDILEELLEGEENDECAMLNRAASNTSSEQELTRFSRSSSSGRSITTPPSRSPSIVGHSSPSSLPRSRRASRDMSEGENAVWCDKMAALAAFGAATHNECLEDSDEETIVDYIPVD